MPGLTCTVTGSNVVEWPPTCSWTAADAIVMFMGLGLRCSRNADFIVDALGHLICQNARHMGVKSRQAYRMRRRTNAVEIQAHGLSGICCTSRFDTHSMPRLSYMSSASDNADWSHVGHRSSLVTVVPSSSTSITSSSLYPRYLGHTIVQTHQ